MRRAFTLIELLVTIGIILILAALAFAAVRWGRQSAREARTRTTIAKIDQGLRIEWEAYRTRPLPLDLMYLARFYRTRQLRDQALVQSGQLPPDQVFRASEELRRYKVNAKRDLVRMEMPDRWSDVSTPPLFLLDFQTGQPIDLSRTLVYRYVYDQAVQRSGAATVEKWASAELLYQIIRNGKGSIQRFNDWESGDIDGDGLFEFWDGWERPISFIRWPAGFSEDHGAADAFVRPDESDAFDRDKLTAGHFTWPLIVSAGPDGKFGLHFGSAGFQYAKDADGNLNPCQQDASHLIGEPLGGEHFDNIHNHSMHRF